MLFMNRDESGCVGRPGQLIVWVEASNADELEMSAVCE